MPEIDLSFLTPPDFTPDAAHFESAAHGLARFAAEVRATIDGLRPRGGFNAANQVLVQPGGQTFSTISAAIASIADASQKKQYVCYIGPGTYAEKLTCKSWVFLAGAGSDQTFITAPATKDTASKGTVIGASSSAIQDLAVEAVGVGASSWATAVACSKIQNFDIENCVATANDPVGGAYVLAVAVDYGTGAAGSVVYVAYTQIATTGHDDSQALGVLAANHSFVQLTSCKVVAQGGSDSWGAAASYLSNLTIDSSHVEGTAFSLRIVDFNATLIANQCTLVGTVGSGVVVNP